MDDARQESHAGIPRRQRRPPDGARPGQSASRGRHRADRRGDQQEPVVCVLGCAAGDAGIAGAAGRSGVATLAAGRRERRGTRRRTRSGSASRLTAEPNRGSTAYALGNSTRRLVVPHDVVQREDRRRQPHRDVPRIVDGHLLRRSTVHGLQGHQPFADGCGGEDQRAVGCVQVRRGPEGILDRPHGARHLARHRRPSAGSPVRRCR